MHEFQLKLKASQHADIVNLMIVADHGMTAGGAGSGVEYVDVEDYIDDDDVQFIFDRGAVVAIVPKPGKTDKVPIKSRSWNDTETIDTDSIDT